MSETYEYRGRTFESIKEMTDYFGVNRSSFGVYKWQHKCSYEEAMDYLLSGKYVTQRSKAKTKFRMLCNELNMSAKDVATLTGIKTSTINGYMQGVRTPDKTNREKLAAAGFDVAELFFRP